MQDEELLRAWASGDEAAGIELYRRHFATLYRFFRTKAPYDYEDLVQTTMLECVRCQANYRGDAPFRVFLLGVARNRLAVHFRHRAGDRLEFDVGHSSVADLDPRPSTITARNAGHQRLYAALRQIPLELQTVLELHYWEDLSTSDLALVLEIPQGTVKSRLRRAREALRSVLMSPLLGGPAPTDTAEDLFLQVRALRATLDEG